MNEILAEAAPRMAGFKHPLMEVAPGEKARRHSGQHGPRLVRRLNSNLLREAAKLDKDHDGFHHRRAQGVAVHRAHETAAGGGVHLQGHAAVRRGAGDFQIRAGSVFEGRGGRGGHFVHATSSPPGAAAEDRSVSAGRKNPAGHGRRQRAGGAEGSAGGADGRSLNLSRTRKRCWARCCRTA